METKNITVAIVTRNRPELLKKTLFSLSWQITKPAQLILIENNEIKTLDKIIEPFRKKFDINYRLEKTIGVASARNLALKACKTPYLCFTDDDCILHRDWIKNINSEIKKDNQFTYLIGCSLLANPSNIFAQMQGHKQSFWLKKKIDNENYLTDGYFDTKNITLNLQKLKKNKLTFNLKLNKNSWGDISDQELGMRINKLRLTGKFVPKMIVFHQEADNLKNMIKKAYLRGRNTFILNQIRNNNKDNYSIWQVFNRNSLKNDWQIFSGKNILKTISLIFLSKIYDLTFLIGYLHEKK